MSTKKRILLTLNQKYAAIQELEKGVPAYKVAEQLGVGKTQIQNLRKRKQEVLTDIEKCPGDTKRRRHTTGNEDINDLTYEWFKNATDRRIPVTGPLLQSQALNFAERLDRKEFKASRGWLESFLKRHEIKFGGMSGERGDTNLETVSQWKEKLHKVCEKFEPKDIFNMDESGLFFRDTTRKTFHLKGVECAGGKRAKNRITVAFCASVMGEKLKPLVIGKSKSPRCFGKVDTKTLPVKYYNNKRAWMDSRIYEDYLKWFNRKMKAQGRKVLLFFDNAPSHPTLQLSNVKVHFLPPNTTAYTQPMDQGIIQTAKLKFRKRQLQYMVREMERKPALDGSSLLKSIDILDAIYWISSSWQEIESETITKCFAKAGFTIHPQDDLVTTGASGETCDRSDDEEDEDDNIPLAVLRASRELFGCPFTKLASVDEHVATCNTNSVDWNQPVQTLLEELKPDSCVPCDSESDTSDTEEAERSESQLTFSEACEHVGRLKLYAKKSGNSTLLQMFVAADDELSQTAVNNQKQSKISDFFQVRNEN